MADFAPRQPAPRPPDNHNARNTTPLNQAKPNTQNAQHIAANDPVKIQPKLEVSSSNDPQEAEADSIAKKVVNGGSANSFSDAQPSIQRKCDSCEKDEDVQRKSEKDDQGFELDAESSALIRQKQQGGFGIPKSILAKMEKGFSKDFSKIRIHRDTESAALNRKIGAKAFTAGKHIFFGQNQFDENSKSGQELIAHELVHTVQQGDGGESIQRAENYEETTLYVQDPLGQKEADPNSLAKPLTLLQQKGLHRKTATRKDPCPGLNKAPKPIDQVLQLPKNFKATLAPPKASRPYDFSQKKLSRFVLGNNFVQLRGKQLESKPQLTGLTDFYVPKLADAANNAQAKSLIGIGRSSITSWRNINQGKQDAWQSKINGNILEEKSNAQAAQNAIKDTYKAARGEVNTYASLLYSNAAQTILFYQSLMAQNETIGFGKIGKNVLALENNLVNGEFKYRSELLKIAYRDARWSFDFYDELSSKVESERACGLEKIAPTDNEEVRLAKTTLVNKISDEAIDDFTETPYEIGHSICSEAEQFENIYAREIPDLQLQIQSQIEQLAELLPATRLWMSENMDASLFTIDEEMQSIFGGLLSNIDTQEVAALTQTNSITNQAIEDLHGLFKVVCESIAAENTSQISLTSAAVNATLLQLESESSEDPIRAYARQPLLEQFLENALKGTTSDLSPMTDQLEAALPGWLKIQNLALQEIRKIADANKAGYKIALGPWVASASDKFGIGLNQSHLSFTAKIDKIVLDTLFTIQLVDQNYHEGFEQTGTEFRYRMQDFTIKPQINANQFVARLPFIFENRFKEIERIANMSKADAMWEAVKHFFTDFGNIMMLIGMVTLFAMLAEISATFAVVFGIALLIVFTGIAIYSRFVALAESNPSDEEIKFFFMYYLGSGLFLLDGLGLGGIVEGLAEIDLSTGKALDKVEAGTRLGEGVSNLAVLLATVGLGKGKAWLDTKANRPVPPKGIASEGPAPLRSRGVLNDPAAVGERSKGWSAGERLEPFSNPEKGKLGGYDRNAGKDPFMPEKGAFETEVNLLPNSQSSLSLNTKHKLHSLKNAEYYVCTNPCIKVTDLIRDFFHLIYRPEYRFALSEIGELCSNGKKIAAWSRKAELRNALLQAEKEYPRPNTNILKGSGLEYTFAKREFSAFESYRRRNLSKMMPSEYPKELLNQEMKKNVGRAEGNIFHPQKGEFRIESGYVESGLEYNKKKIYESLKVDSDGVVDSDASWSREYDSEYHLLNDIANLLQVEPFKIYDNFVGQIKIYSKYHVCSSCEGVLLQFSKMFPNIELIIIDGLL